MRLLIVTPSLHLPPVRGYEVILCKQLELLSAKHTIDLVTFVGKGYQEDKMTPVRSYCNSIFTVSLARWKSVINVLFGFFSREPFQSRYYRSPKMTSLINNIVQKNNYDVIIINLIRMAQYLPKWYKGPAVLNMVDPLIFNYERSLSWRPWYLRPVLREEIKRLKNYEAKITSLFSRVTLIAQADITDYKQLFNTSRMALVPYGIDLSYFKPDNAISRSPGMIIISGNMGYAPNVDGVKYFCRDVYPIVLSKEPGANLWLVGTNPSKEIKKFGNGKTIFVTGYVNDIRPYLNRAMVSVCPVRLKVGTQTKILEALAIGTPVVTTSAGNNGIGGISGESLYVANSPAEMAERVVSLLKKSSWTNLAESGRKFVVDNFEWQKTVTNFEGVLQNLVSEYQLKPDSLR